MANTFPNDFKISYLFLKQILVSLATVTIHGSEQILATYNCLYKMEDNSCHRIRKFLTLFQLVL